MTLSTTTTTMMTTPRRTVATPQLTAGGSRPECGVFRLGTGGCRSESGRYQLSAGGSRQGRKWRLQTGVMTTACQAVASLGQVMRLQAAEWRIQTGMMTTPRQEAGPAASFLSRGRRDSRTWYSACSWSFGSRSATTGSSAFIARYVASIDVVTIIDAQVCYL